MTFTYISRNFFTITLLVILFLGSNIIFPQEPDTYYPFQIGIDNPFLNPEIGMKRVFPLLNSIGLKGIRHLNYADVSWKQVEPGDDQWKKSYDAFKLMINKLEGFSNAEKISFGIVTDNNNNGGNGVWVVQFNFQYGKKRLVMWSPDHLSYTLSGLPPNNVITTKVVPSWISANGEQATFNSDTLTVSVGQVVFHLTEYPMLVEELNITNVQNPHQQEFSFVLQQNYPNPFNPSATIQFTLPVRQHITLRVFDVSGREVTTLANSEFSAGKHSLVFDAKQLASGVYFYRLTTATFSQTKKMEIVR